MEELDNSTKKDILIIDQGKSNSEDKGFVLQINFKKKRKITQRTKPVFNIPIFEINRQYYERIEKPYQQKKRIPQYSITNIQKEQLLNLDINIKQEKKNSFDLNESDKSKKEKNDKFDLNEPDKLGNINRNIKMPYIPEINDKEMSEVSSFTENEDNFSYTDVKDSLKFMDDQSSISSDQVYNNLNSDTTKQNNFIYNVVNNNCYNQIQMLFQMKFLNQLFSNNMNNNINMNLNYNQNLNLMNKHNSSINFYSPQNFNYIKMIDLFNFYSNNQINDLRNINNIYNPVNLSFMQRTRMNNGNEGIVKVKYSSKLEKCNK